MYCKYCGNEIDDKSIYCNMCGKRQQIQKSKAETKPEAIKGSDDSPVIFKMLIINLILGFSYFVGWIKLSGATGKIAEFLMAVFGLDIKEISPRIVMNAIDYIRELNAIASDTVPFNYYLLYLLIAIPILASIGILFTLAKRPFAVHVGRLTAFISLICEAYAWYLATQANMGATYWLYLFTTASVYFFFVLRSYSDSFAVVFEDDENNNGLLEEKEADFIPEEKQIKSVKAKARKGSDKAKADKRNELHDYCSYCGEDLTGETKLCPVCGRNLNR